MADETVVILTDARGRIHKVFRVPTVQMSKRTEDEIIEVAKKYNQLVEFHPVGWSGIEAVKWDIKAANGDT